MTTQSDGAQVRYSGVRIAASVMLAYSRKNGARRRYFARATFFESGRCGSGRKDYVVSALVWWAIPLAITALAIAFVALRSRIAEPEPDPMAERLRLREAMERSSRRAKRSSRRSPDNPR